jgi:hypothetical protein
VGLKFYELAMARLWQSGYERNAREQAFEGLSWTLHELWLSSRVHHIPGALAMTSHQGRTVYRGWFGCMVPSCRLPWNRPPLAQPQSQPGDDRRSQQKPGVVRAMAWSDQWRGVSSPRCARPASNVTSSQYIATHGEICPGVACRSVQQNAATRSSPSGSHTMTTRIATGGNLGVYQKAMCEKTRGVLSWAAHRSTREWLSPLTSHTAMVISATFSPDSKRVATRARDGTAKVWDASSGRELFIIARYPWAAFNVAFNPAAPRLALSSQDGKVYIYYTVDVGALVAIACTRVSRSLITKERQI